MDEDLNHLETQIEMLIDSKKQLRQEIESLKIQLVKLAQQNQDASLQIQRIISQLKEEINAA